MISALTKDIKFNFLSKAVTFWLIAYIMNHGTKNTSEFASYNLKKQYIMHCQNFSTILIRNKFLNIDFFNYYNIQSNLRANDQIRKAARAWLHLMEYLTIRPYYFFG